MNIKTIPARRAGGLNRPTAFDFFNYAVMAFVVLLILYPCLYVVKQSFEGGAANSISLGLIPHAPSLDNYRKVFINEYIGYGFLNTLRRLVVGAPLTLIVTILAAYPLSKRGLPNRAFWTGIFVFTMFFSGGMIPVGLYNSLLALILPGAISVFNAIICKTAIEAIPESLHESAYIDGANDITIMFRIVAPLIMPTIAVLLLYYGVGHWNSWFPASLYLKDNEKLPIQNVLRAVLIANSSILNSAASDADQINQFAETIKYSAIMIGTLPILCIYPFLQKYFVKGVMVGAVKG